MPFDYLVAAANQIAGAVEYVDNNPKRLDPKSLREFLRLGCISLRQISNDNDFKQLLIDNSHMPYNQKFDASAFEEYLSSFIKVDKGLMLEAGMSPKVVRYLFSDIATIRKALRSDSTPDFGVMANRFSDLATVVCGESIGIREEEERRNFLASVVKSIGGAAVIAVNAASDFAATFEMASKVSMTFGGGLLVTVLKRRRDSKIQQIRRTHVKATN